MNKKYKVAAYLRLSQEDGDKDISDSIVSQKNIIEKKVKDLGDDFYIVDYYIDDGYTGLNTERPGFQKMLSDIEQGIVNSIITKDLSRLSRNSFEANYYIEIYFLERNIRYISVLDNVDTGSKNSNNDIIQFKTLINDWYSKDISRKIKSSLWARKEKGMFVGSIAPFGYTKSKRDKHKLIINTSEARVVRRIFNEYDKGKTICDIIQQLQKDGIPSPNNNRNNGEIIYNWRVETIRRILKNQVYLGHTQYGKRINLSYKSKKVKYIPSEEWKIVYNTHDPIISQVLFDRVQNKINTNKTIKRRKYEWNLNGLVKCKECKEKMTLKVKYKDINSNDIKSKKLYCLNGIRKGQGKNCIKACKGINEEVIDTVVINSLKRTVKHFIDKEKLLELVINYNKENNQKSLIIDKENLYKQLKKKENDAKILYEDYKNKLLDKDDYVSFYTEISNNKNRIKNDLKKLEKEQKNVLDESKIRPIIDEVLNMKDINREIISDILYNIEIDKDNKIYINYRYDISKGW